MLPPVPFVGFLALLAFGYVAAFTVAGGQTIGKMMLNLRVIGDDGRPVDAAGGMLRALGCMLVPITLGLSYRARAVHAAIIGRCTIGSPARAWSRNERRSRSSLRSFGYVGFFPIAPGTAGSLAALALFAFMRWIGVPAFELAAIVAVLRHRCLGRAAAPSARSAARIRASS